MAHNQELVWWWKQLWKLKCPAKAKLLFWAILENKTPTWDILQKIFLEGPGLCALCKKANETIHHLFVHCSYTKTIWTEVGNLMGFNGQWQGDTVLQDFQRWWTGHHLLRVVPCIISWGIWIMRNWIIFQDIHILMEAVVA